MSRFFLRTRNPIKLLIPIRHDSTSPTTTTKTTHLLLHHHHLCFLHKTSQELDPNHSSSFTVSYLINSCGLSPQSALSASQKINLKTTENADSLLTFLKSYGFTKTQIAEFISKRPAFLASDLENTLKPKLDYFLAAGFSVSQLADLPMILMSSLDNRLKPNFELLASIIGDTHKLFAALRRSIWLLTNNLDTNFLPNVRTLESYGVPPCYIAKLVVLYPRVMMQASEKFAATVWSIKKFGIDPNMGLFVKGVSVMSGMNLSTWERKVAVYKSLGWSEKEVISAFTKGPFCMLLSEEKIRRGMDFYVKKLQWMLSFLVANPALLCLSLEKRVIPRCSVMNVLASKGLVGMSMNPSVKSLMIREKKFLDKYVIKYQDQVPEVCQAYNGNLGFVGQESAVVQGSLSVVSSVAT